MEQEAWPLKWPTAWPRTPEHKRERARFATSFANARDGLLNELRMMGVARHQVVISSNVALRRDGFPYATRNSPDDPAVAVYFMLDGKQRCIPCDRWTRVEDNVQAIRKTIEALRALDRWGAKHMVDAAFDGFVALPEKVENGWWVVLGVTRDASWPEVSAAYREAVKQHHPDRGGDVEEFHRVRNAYAVAQGDRGV